MHSWLVQAWGVWFPARGAAWCSQNAEPLPARSLGHLGTRCLCTSLGTLVRRRPENVAGAAQCLPQFLLPRCPAAFLPGGLACLGLGSRWGRGGRLGGSSPARPVLPGSVAAQAWPGAEGGCTHFTGHGPLAGGSVLPVAIFCGHRLLFKATRLRSGALGAEGVPPGCTVNIFEALGGAGSGVTGCAAGRWDSVLVELCGGAGRWGPPTASSRCRHSRAAGPRLAFLAGTGIWPSGPPCGMVSGQRGDTLAFAVVWGFQGGGSRGHTIGAGVGCGPPAGAVWPVIWGGNVGKGSDFHGHSRGHGPHWGRRGGRGRRSPWLLFSGIL